MSSPVWFCGDMYQACLVEHDACKQEFIWWNKSPSMICPCCGEEFHYPEGANW